MWVAPQCSLLLIQSASTHRVSSPENFFNPRLSEIRCHLGVTVSLTSLLSWRSQEHGNPVCICTCKRSPLCAYLHGNGQSEGLHWELEMELDTSTHKGPRGRTTAHLPYMSSCCCFLERTVGRVNKIRKGYFVRVS